MKNNSAGARKRGKNMKTEKTAYQTEDGFIYNTLEAAQKWAAHDDNVIIMIVTSGTYESRTVLDMSGIAIAPAIV